MTLLAKPRQAHIADYSVRTPLAFAAPGSPALASAHLELEVHVVGASAGDLGAASVVYHVLDYETKAPVLPPGALAVSPGHWYAADAAGAAGRGAAGHGGVARLRLDVLAALAGAASPGGEAAPLRLWSAEAPALYLLVLELQSGGGATLECEACQVRGPGAGGAPRPPCRAPRCATAGPQRLRC